MEDPAVMENQELSTGTGVEATHRPRPRLNQSSLQYVMQIRQRKFIEYHLTPNFLSHPQVQMTNSRTRNLLNHHLLVTIARNPLVTLMLCFLTTWYANSFLFKDQERRGACLKVLSVNYKTSLVLFLKSMATGGLEKIRIIIFSNRHVKTLILTIGFQHKLLL